MLTIYKTIEKKIQKINNISSIQNKRNNFIYDIYYYVL